MFVVVVVVGVLFISGPLFRGQHIFIDSFVWIMYTENTTALLCCSTPGYNGTMSLGSTQSWLVGRASNNTSQSPSQVNMKTTHDYHFRVVTIDWNIYKEFQTLEILGETIYQQPQ